MPIHHTHTVHTQHHHTVQDAVIPPDTHQESTQEGPGSTAPVDHLVALVYVGVYVCVCVCVCGVVCDVCVCVVHGSMGGGGGLHIVNATESNAYTDTTPTTINTLHTHTLHTPVPQNDTPPPPTTPPQKRTKKHTCIHLGRRLPIQCNHPNNRYNRKP